MAAQPETSVLAAPSEAPTQEGGKSRRRLLALLGVGGAALVAGHLSRDEAMAGHDNTNVMHLGEQNIAPFGKVTQINGNVAGPTLVLHNDDPSGGALQADQPVNIGVNVNGAALTIDNGSTEAPAHGISATARAGPAIQGVAMVSPPVEDSFAILGVSSLPDSWGDGPGVGVQGLSGTGTAVAGYIAAGTGTGVSGHSDSGIGGHFTTNTGESLVVDGPAAFENANGGDSNAIWAERSGGDGETIIARKVGTGDGFTIEALRDGPGDGACLNAIRAGSGGGSAVEAVREGSGGGRALSAEHLGGGVAIHGHSETGVGGQFSTNSGTALAVYGKSVFSTAGSGVIPFGQDSAFVGNPAVTPDSHITATLAGNPGAVITGFPAVLHWVERQPGVGFVVHMTRRVGQTTPFTYLIVEPG